MRAKLANRRRADEDTVQKHRLARRSHLQGLNPN